MDQLQTRSNGSSRDLLEKRFIGKILKEEGEEFHMNQTQLMSSRGFTNTQFYNARDFQVLEDHKLLYTHPTVLRFVDMKSRTSKNGQKSKKKHHPIHNKPLFGMVNNMLRRLSFEFTDRMKATLRKEYNIEL